MSFSNLPVLRDFDPTTPDSEFETTGFGLFQDIRDLAIAYNAGAQDIRNNALSILQDTPTATLDALIQAKFSSVTPNNLIYVDGAYAGGDSDGSSSKPYNDLWVAINSCIDGVTNNILVRTDHTYELGVGNEGSSVHKDFRAPRTVISFQKWGTGVTPLIKINYTDNGTYSISAFAIRATNMGARLVVAFQSVDVETTVNANGFATINAGFIRTLANTSVEISFYASDITIANNGDLFAPYVYNKGAIGLYFYSGTLYGDGNIIQDVYLHPKLINVRALTRDGSSTANLISHMSTAKSEIVIEDENLSFLAETTV